LRGHRSLGEAADRHRTPERAVTAASLDEVFAG
jgi:hypothetical protein